MIHKAIAVSCSTDEELPEVLARGIGEVADEIVALAEEFNIPIVETDKDELESMVAGGSYEQLSGAELDLVAEVVAFLLHFDQGFVDKYPSLAKYAPASPGE